MRPSSKLPVLIVGYQRPRTLRRVLEAVREYRPVRVYLACDGPRGEEESREAVARVRETMLGVDWVSERYFFFSEANQGLADFVPAALDWFFSLESRGIVLEDDCLPNSSFFGFMEFVLNQYERSPEVWGAGGYNPTQISFSGRDFGFVSLPIIWGWATWAVRWNSRDRDIDSVAEADQEDKWASPTLRYELLSRLQMQSVRKTTWDYQWSWSVASRGGVWAMPSRNFVVNLGMGGAATHTRRNLFSDQATSNFCGPYTRVPVEISAHSEKMFLERHLRIPSHRPLATLKVLLRRLLILWIRLVVISRRFQAEFGASPRQ